MYIYTYYSPGCRNSEPTSGLPVSLPSHPVRLEDGSVFCSSRGFSVQEYLAHKKPPPPLGPPYGPRHMLL